MQPSAQYLHGTLTGVSHGLSSRSNGGYGNSDKNRGTLGSFSQSVWSPSSGSIGLREESYHLLLELCSQEPTMQCCFKIIESTCLARGIDVEIGGRPPSPEFREFIARHYLPFAESAIRYFFALGFVPWRLRKLSTGDVVPEAIPLGIFTWSIESITNRVSKGLGNASNVRGFGDRKEGVFAGRGGTALQGVEQMAAEKGFQKRKAFFSDPKRVPYPLQGDVMRMGNRSDLSNGAAKRRLLGFTAQQMDSKMKAPGNDEKGVNPMHSARVALTAGQDDAGSDGKRARPAMHNTDPNTPSYYRQKQALNRQQMPPDDDESKILRYCVRFTEHFDVLEEEVEVYEYLAPTNSITRCSVLYGTVPSPLSHVLIDYRNIRTALIRQAYADSYNTQAKMICSYTAQKNMYNVSEGGPILNSEGWAPQQRLGMQTDANLPTEMEANAFSRDCLAETIVGSKAVEHKPVIYSLPKNTAIEQQQKLESIIDVPRLQVSARQIMCWVTLTLPLLVLVGP